MKLLKYLDVLIDDCKDILDDMGIEYGPIISVKVNYRLTACWGRCRRTKDGYYIQLSGRLMDDSISYEAIMNTLIHEFLHAGKNRMQHTGEWKRLANVINREYPQFNISRTTSADEKGVANLVKNYKYIITCAKCGNTYKYQKAGKVVHALKMDPYRYRCACGNSNLILREVR